MGMAFAWEEKNEWNKCYCSWLFLDSHKSYRHLCILCPHSKSQVCQFQHKSCKQAIFWWWIFTERFFLRASFWHCKQFLFFYKRKSLLQWLLSFILFCMKWWNVKRTFLTIIFPTLLLLFTWHFHIRVWAFVCLFIHFFLLKFSFNYTKLTSGDSCICIWIWGKLFSNPRTKWNTPEDTCEMRGIST